MKKERVAAIIQARTGASRLPGMVERIIRSRLVSKVVVATTINIKDLAIVKLCAEL